MNLQTERKQHSSRPLLAQVAGVAGGDVAAYTPCTHACGGGAVGAHSAATYIHHAHVLLTRAGLQESSTQCIPSNQTASQTKFCVSALGLACKACMPSHIFTAARTQTPAG